MIARGFRSVVWVAAVGGAALGCYMLSLRVATERADLARVERGIVATKQQIRSLQTELGTRGRLSQLEQWNADVLALSAPATGQFLRDEFLLARLDMRDQSVAERAPVRMAAMEASENPPAAAPAVAAKPKLAVEEQAPAEVQPALVHRASYARAQQPLEAAKPARRLGAGLAEELGAAASGETAETASRPAVARAETGIPKAGRPKVALPRAAARGEAVRTAGEAGGGGRR